MPAGPGVAGAQPNEVARRINKWTVANTMQCTKSSYVRIRPWLRIAQQRNSVALAAKDRIIRYEGRATILLCALLPRLNGKRDVQGIATDLGVPNLANKAVELCRRLVDDNLADIVEIDDPQPATDGLTADVLAGHTPHDEATIQVVGTATEAEALAQVCPPQWTIRRTTLPDLINTRHSDGECAIVWISDINDARITPWNELAYAENYPWLPITGFDGTVATVGPYIYPSQTPCYECYRRRRASRSALGDEFLALEPIEPHHTTDLAFIQILAGVAMTQLQLFMSARHPYVPGALKAVTLGESLAISTEYVLRVPRCTACRPTAAANRPALWSQYFDLENV